MLNNFGKLINDKIIVLWSGGLDSTGLIFTLLKNYNSQIHPVFLKHGQRNEKFEEAAVNHYSKIFNDNFNNKLHDFFTATSYIPAIEFKQHNYKNKHFLRNSDLINNAVRYGLHHDITTIFIATFHYDMADGQPQFFEAKEKEIEIATGINFKVTSPFFYDDFVCNTKSQLIKYCKKEKFDLIKTRSCYTDSNECGICDGCKNRAQAFADAFEE